MPGVDNYGVQIVILSFVAHVYQKNRKIIKFLNILLYFFELKKLNVKSFLAKSVKTITNNLLVYYSFLINEISEVEVDEKGLQFYQ